MRTREQEKASLARVTAQSLIADHYQGKPRFQRKAYSTRETQKAQSGKHEVVGMVSHVRGRACGLDLAQALALGTEKRARRDSNFGVVECRVSGLCIRSTEYKYGTEYANWF